MVAEPSDVWLILAAVVFVSLLLGAVRWWLALIVLPAVIAASSLTDTMRELSTAYDLEGFALFQSEVAAAACLLAPIAIAFIMKRIYTRRMRSQRTHPENSGPQR